MKIKRTKALALILLLIFVMAALLSSCSAAAISYSYGASGQKVKEIQTKLKRWGYYTGAIDGIYGSSTVSSVKWFQRKNGITADGIVGKITAQKMGLSLSSGGSSGQSSSGQSSATSDVYLLARVVYGEARGEPYKGQVAVAAVVLNRVRSSKFPNTIAKVVYQKNAFSIVNDGQINLTPDDTAIRAAKDALNGYDPTGGAIYYFNPAKTNNAFMHSRPVITVIGSHTFCS